MREGERGRMQEETVLRQATLAAMTVTRVVDHGMSDRGHVDPDLVGPTGIELQAQQRHGVRLVDAPQDLVAGARRPPVNPYRHHGGCARRTPDWRIDDAPLLGDVAFDHAQVGAFHQSLGELRAEVQESLGSLRDDEHS